MVDITKYAVSETSTLHLKDAAGNLLFEKDAEGRDDPSKPVEVELYGPGSKEHAQANAKRSSRNIQRLRKKGNMELSADDMATEGAEYLAAITKGFNNLEYPGKTGVEMFKAVYSNRQLGFIADQVQEHIGDWENFTKGSATS